MRYRFWMVATLPLLLLLAACDVSVLTATPSANAGATRAALDAPANVSESSANTFTVTGTPTIDVDDTSGVVTLGTGPDGTVTVRTETRSVTQDALAKMDVTVTQASNVIRARYSQPANTPRAEKTDFIITAPPNANLLLRMTVGDINVRGFASGLDASVTVGNLVSENVSGDLTLQVTNGALAAKGVNGRIHAGITSGTLDIDGAISGQSVVQSTVATTHVLIPASSNMTIQARLGKGKLENDFGFNLKQDKDGQFFDGTLGDGSGLLSIRSTSGALTLGKT